MKQSKRFALGGKSTTRMLRILIMTVCWMVRKLLRVKYIIFLLLSLIGRDTKPGAEETSKTVLRKFPMKSNREYRAFRPG